MAVVGSIRGGASGDCATPAVESVLDLIIVAVTASSMGKGAAFSAIPVGVFEDPITLPARLLEPLMGEGATANVLLVGSIPIFCVGATWCGASACAWRTCFDAIVLAIAAAHLPWGL